MIAASQRPADRGQPRALALHQRELGHLLGVGQLRHRAGETLDEQARRCPRLHVHEIGAVDGAGRVAGADRGQGVDDGRPQLGQAAHVELARLAQAEHEHGLGSEGRMAGGKELGGAEVAVQRSGRGAATNGPAQRGVHRRLGSRRGQPVEAAHHDQRCPRGGDVALGQDQRQRARPAPQGHEPPRTACA
jgi:hypothetical protein